MLTVASVFVDNAQEFINRAAPSLTEQELILRFNFTVNNAISYGLTTVHNFLRENEKEALTTGYLSVDLFTRERLKEREGNPEDQEKILKTRADTDAAYPEHPSCGNSTRNSGYLSAGLFTRERRMSA
ncbi:hypothetical protein K435DRAFT_789548 [Dendrothele bispora CBS 962.96]|uniref:Uncharacterized protein n=1 Tax=Dendrothele bispora (strain CBS 962.96) TaxID=1314807 RepID=A0A4S8MT90_DENBC|nr:hypothetical protein K435DRAFT_789548 [Dendrothele bispora CBS 962.96]